MGGNKDNDHPKARLRQRARQKTQEAAAAVRRMVGTGAGLMTAVGLTIVAGLTTGVAIKGVPA